MKAFLIHILILIISISLNGKTIGYYLQSYIKVDAVLNEDMCDEESNKEEKKTEEETEKSDYLDKLFASQEKHLNINQKIGITYHESITMNTSQYYKVIYSPPEA